MKQVLFIVVVCVLAGTILTSCSKNASYTPPPDTKVSFANLSARHPSLDFYGGTAQIVKVASAINYQSVSGFTTAAATLYGVVADTAGQSDNNPVIAQLTTLGGGTANTVIVVDTSLQATRAVITTDFFTTVSADSARIRCFHFSPDAPKLDFYISSVTTPDFTRDFLFRQNSNENVASLAFKYYLKGDYVIIAREAGTSNEVARLPVSLAGTKHYTLYSSGFLSKAGTAEGFKIGLLLQDF
ncbi:DUF4397 domain-containing protein [Filimonas effusa]|uniref:DUF4397 domain-containing protein n=1 Tax=Filimonas effusa TaxID=2508721 RepID=A0A4Q1D236_9BACT|nr:DUF4397 domain-containing protein [Filimonas effusa]RXK81891.1 DUF4397 domain-containing protein [Filimonas effusa]